MRTLLLGIFLFGCSGKVVDSAPADSGALDSAAVDSVAEDAPIDEAACIRERDKIAAMVMGPMCTTTVRISTVDFRVLGSQTACGSFPGALLTESAARKALASYPEYVKIEDFSMVDTGSATTPWLFAHPPSDFGGVGAVDARTGQPVYYATLSWSTLGTVKLPSSGSVPLVCKPLGTPHGYRVIPESAPPTAADAMTTLERSPILQGIERMQAIVGITLLHVSLDGSVPDAPDYHYQNEWVAFVSSTILE